MQSGSTNNFFKNFFSKKIVIVSIIIVIIIIIVSIYLSSSKVATFESSVASIGNVIEKVTVTGKVAPYQKADLSFEKAGIIFKINFKVGDKVKKGDIIAELSNSDTKASLLNAQANLSAEQTRLIQLANGLRPEEISVEYSKLKSAQILFDDSKIVMINAMNDSYIKTTSSISNYIDTFFTNSNTVVPRIKIRTENYNQENGVNNSRILANEKLKLWKIDLDSMNLNSDPDKYITNIYEYLNITKSLFSQLSTIVAGITVGNSGVNQSTIDSYNLTLSTGLSIFNTAVGAITSADANYKNASSSLALAKNQFNLSKSGSSEETLVIQQAKVDQAQANVSIAQSELSKKSLASPFQGILTKAIPDIGEFVSSGQLVFSVIDDSTFKIEINVPEADIAKVAIGNKADVNLDSYGQYVIFPATVISIDPAETIIEGVATYKVTLLFDSLDERIRSGMTANTDIFTHQVQNVITVPSRAIIDDGGKKTVRLINSDGKTFSSVSVIVGLKGSDGTSQIISGINEGDKVVTYIK